jgi:Protein of unknown function (DUF3237)
VEARVIALEYEMTYHLKTKGPLPRTHGSPAGVREYWEMTSGTLVGPRINATIAMPGGDWFRAGDDGYGRPDVRVQLVTDDEELILLEYTGLVESTPTFIDAAGNDGETQWDDQYMRMSMRFDTGATKYSWLNQSLFVARGRLLGRNDIEYEIYRVT